MFSGRGVSKEISNMKWVKAFIIPFEEAFINPFAPREKKNDEKLIFSLFAVSVSVSTYVCKLFTIFLAVDDLRQFYEYKLLSSSFGCTELIVNKFRLKY